MVRSTLFAILVLAVLGFCLYTGPAADMTAVLIGSLEELTIPPDAVRVSGNTEIIEFLLETIRARKTIVYFDTRDMDVPVMDTALMYAYIMNSHPDFEYVEGLRTHQEEDRHFLSAAIQYRYFISNQDIFCMKPGLYAVLDKKVITAGESARIDLSGENASAYSLDVSSESPVIEIGKEDRITALTPGSAYLRVTATDRYDRRKIYTHTFKIQVLPEDTPRVDDMDGLIAAAKKGLNRTSQPILIRDKDLRQSEMEEALGDLGKGLITSRFNDEMTAIENTTDSGTSLAECAGKIGILEEKIAEIVSGLTRPGMTDLEKEAALYDYLIRNASYDYRVYDDPDNYPYDSGTIYGTLINGTGVCTGYAYALQKLLNAAGIECMTVLGNYEDQYHMWNIAKIDGVYLQLDPTFDSVYTHAYPGLSHAYFNQTDEQMRKDHDWDAAAYPPCTGLGDR